MRTRASAGRVLAGADRGSAVLVVLVLLSILVVLVAANTRTVNGLRREVKVIERQQIQRLASGVVHAAPAPATNP